MTVDNLVDRVSRRLVDRGLRLALAESCTGGMVAQRMTARPGSSQVFEAGLVTYSNEAKEALLGVSNDTLVAHGAVSEAVAREMVEGARAVTGAGAAISITGIAGPAGGSPDKPVGTVWLGAAVASIVRLERVQLEGDRSAVRAQAADLALALLEAVLDETE